MMRGLGADDVPITEQTVAYMASLTCDIWSANVHSLGPTLLELLYMSFTGAPPNGVSQQTFDAFTLRALQCNLYSLHANADGGDWIRAQFPLPEAGCLDDTELQVQDYVKAHPGYDGPEAWANAFTWVAGRDPAYLANFLALDACAPEPAAAYDENFPITDYSVAFLAAADCGYLGGLPLGPSLVTLLAASFIGVAPEGVSQQSFDAFTLKAISCQLYSHMATPTGAQAIRQALGLDTMQCADDVALEQLAYAQQYGYQGSDAQSNMVAWLMGRDPGVWADCLAMPPCQAPAETPPETTPAAPAPEPAPAPGPVVTSTPSAEQPTYVAPTYQTSVEPSAEQPLTVTAPAPGPASDQTTQRSSMMTYGLIALAVIVVGGALYYARKR